MGITISGTNSANVQKDIDTVATGQLTASDTNSGATVTWSIVGGSTPQSPSYQFAIDQFQVVRNGTAIFDDAFTSLTPPNFSNGSPASYGTAGGTLVNNGHQDILSGNNAGVLNANAGTDGQIAVLKTDTSDDPTKGLKGGTSFSIAGTFDLVQPTDPRNQYGIELTDKGAGDGHDQVRLVVEHTTTGAIVVALQQVNSVIGATETLQAIKLAPGANDDQIELQLSNDGSVNNGQVTASFTLLNHGAVDSTTTFTATGSIFLGENGQAENWTQAGFLALAPHLSDSVLQGIYGTLDVEQNGAWTYALANAQANVQALTGNVTTPEIPFTVQAADNQGASATKPVSITVYGVNPTLSVEITGVIGAGHPAQGSQSFSQLVGLGDSAIDSGYFLTHPFSSSPAFQSQYNQAVAAGGGLPTSIGGLMNSQDLASDYSLTAIPVGMPGGTNYAASGATVVGNLSPFLAPSIDSQIHSYLASVNNVADPNALYLISGGSNDAVLASFLDPVSGANLLVAHAATLAADLAQLQGDGARYIVIEESGGLFTSALLSDLAAAGVQVITANAVPLLTKVQADPAAYGIFNANKALPGPFTAAFPYNPADGGADVNPDPSLFPAGWALEATQLVSPNAGQTYLFADDQHLSAAGQQLKANFIHDLIQNAVPTFGETLTANPTLIGSNGSIANVTYQWQSLSTGQSTWTDIAGATGPTHVVGLADDNSQLRVEAFLTDPATGQHVTATSPPTFPISFPEVPIATLQADYLGITRTPLSLDQATTIADDIAAGTETEAHFINDLLLQVANTTTPAVAVEATMYGVTGTSAEITFLASQFLPAQIANAIAVGIPNPQVYACEALGLAFAFNNETRSTAFGDAFGPSVFPNSTDGDTSFAAAAASAIFGSAQNPHTPVAIEGFVANWKTFYSSNGIPGIPSPTADQIDLAARGAAWGDAVGVALAGNLGVLPGQVTIFLEDAAQGTAIYGAPLSSQPPPHPFQGSTAMSNVQLLGVADQSTASAVEGLH